MEAKSHIIPAGGIEGVVARLIQVLYIVRVDHRESQVFRPHGEKQWTGAVQMMQARGQHGEREIKYGGRIQGGTSPWAGARSSGSVVVKVDGKYNSKIMRAHAGNSGEHELVCCQ